MGLCGLLLALLLVDDARATEVRLRWTTPDGHQGVRRIWNRYTGEWRWVGMGAHRDTIFDAETGRGRRLKWPPTLGRYFIYWRKEFATNFSLLASSQCGKAGAPDSLLVNLPAGWRGQLYIATESNGGARSLVGNAPRISVP